MLKQCTPSLERHRAQWECFDGDCVECGEGTEFDCGEDELYATEKTCLAKSECGDGGGGGGGGDDKPKGDCGKNEEAGCDKCEATCDAPFDEPTCKSGCKQGCKCIEEHARNTDTDKCVTIDACFGLKKRLRLLYRDEFERYQANKRNRARNSRKRTGGVIRVSRTRPFGRTTRRRFKQLQQLGQDGYVIYTGK